MPEPEQVVPGARVGLETRSGHCGLTALTGLPENLAAPIHPPAQPGRARSSPFSRPHRREELGLGPARTAQTEGSNPPGAAPQTPFLLFSPFSEGRLPPGYSREPRRLFQTFPKGNTGAAPAPSRSLPEVIHLAEDLLILDVAAVLLAQRGAAHGALQAPDVPDEVVDLRQRRG